jgi:molybdopterin molybdotransferase
MPGTPLSLEEARARMLAGLEPLGPERVPLAEASGRILAADVIARHTLPPWDNSAMDGFAVREADVAAAADAPVVLRVVGEVAAGHPPKESVEEGTAVRVLTGGMLPPGADAVVPVEDTDAPMGASALPDRVAIRAATRRGAHVRRAGTDVRAGDVVLRAGARLGPAAIAILAASGAGEALVHRRPVTGVLSTGDELVPAGRELGPAQIPDSNSESVAAQATEAGSLVVRLGIATDERDDVRRRLQHGLESSDVLVATGGVSVGAHDVVRDVFEELGRLDLWRVAIQPGKPLAFGRARRPGGGECLFFGLPGNPVSSFVTFELFVRPALRILRGERDPSGRVLVEAVLAERVAKSSGRRAFLRVRVEPDASGEGGYRAHLAGGQGSHVLTALAGANGLAIIPEEVTELPAGARVEVIRLDMEVV